MSMFKTVMHKEQVYLTKVNSEIVNTAILFEDI